MVDFDVLAKGLTEAQRTRLMTFGAEPRQMGIGLMQYLPGLLKPDGINHPIFGSHYSLNETGDALRAHFKDIQDGQ